MSERIAELTENQLERIKTIATNPQSLRQILENQYPNILLILLGIREQNSELEKAKTVLLEAFFSQEEAQQTIKRYDGSAIIVSQHTTPIILKDPQETPDLTEKDKKAIYQSLFEHLK